ncbi:hypothetical protein Avbf_07761 [Armadillidium vulgare]|nr:hypothetical protein Avbf_07761 [Armadillidium vulgare]
MSDSFKRSYIKIYHSKHSQKMENRKIGIKNNGTYATDLFTDESVKIINEHDPSKPLFLYLAQLAPHVGNPGARFQAPKEVIQRFSYIEDEERRVYAVILIKPNITNHRNQ